MTITLTFLIVYQDQQREETVLAKRMMMSMRKGSQVMDKIDTRTTRALSQRLPRQTQPSKILITSSQAPATQRRKSLISKPIGNDIPFEMVN